MMLVSSCSSTSIPDPEKIQFSTVKRASLRSDNSIYLNTKYWYAVNTELEKRRFWQLKKMYFSKNQIKLNATETINIAINDPYIAKKDVPLRGDLIHRNITNISLKSVEELIENEKIDKDYQDMNGDTALHQAIRYGRLDIAEFLVEEEADVELENKIGDTAADIAEQLQLEDLEDLFE